TYQNNEFFPVWEEVNATLAKLLNKDESTKSESDSTEVTAKTAAPAEDNAEEVTATNNETKDESDLLSQLDNDSTKKDSSSSDLLSQLGEESGEDSLALFQKSVKENPLFAIMTIPTYTN